MSRRRDPVVGAEAAAIWTRTLWWTYAIAGSLFVLGEASGVPQEQATTAIVVSCAVIASALPLVWAVTRWGAPWAHRRRIPVVVLYPLAVVATSLGALVSGIGHQLLGDPLQMTTGFLLDILIVGPIWIILIGSGVALWQTDRVRRGALTRSLQELDSLAGSGADAARVIQATVEREIHESFADSHDLRLREGLDADAGAWRDISMRLRSTATEVMRPFSHSLEAGGRTRTSRLWAPLSWLRQIVTQQDFNQVLVSAVFAAGVVTENVDDYGWVAGLGLLVAEILTIVAVLGGANRLMRGRVHRAPIFFGAVVILQVIYLFPWPQILGEAPRPSVGEQIVAVIASILLILITSGIGLLRDSASERRQRLQRVVEQVGQLEVREAAEVSYALRSLASRVHGTLQALLTATAMAIDEAVAEQRWDDARQSLDHVTSVLQQGTWTADVGSASLAESLEEVCGPWRAVGDVVISLDPRCEHLSSPTITSVTRVVQEAVTNAFRHGSARHVEVWVSVMESMTEVTVIDDGVGPESNIEQSLGLGTSLIESLTEGHWTLDQRDGRTMLSARLN